MGLILFIVILFVGGFIVGGLARWAVPGPDPMPVWATAALGIGGAIIGGIIARILIGTGGGFLFAFDGFVVPLILRTYWRAAACTSSSVAGGSKL